MPFSKRPSGCNLVVVSFTIYQKTIDKCKEKPKRKWICFLIKNHLSVENMILEGPVYLYSTMGSCPYRKKRCIMGTMTNPFGVLLKFILRRICAKIFWNDPIWTDFIQILFFCFVVVWRNAMLPLWAEKWILLPKFATDQCESSHTKVLYFV